MLKFPNTRYSKAWKQHAKPPFEMEYSRVINRKHWDEEKEEAISCIWGNYEVQCLLAALARPSFVENGSSEGSAQTAHLGRDSSFVPRRHHGLRSRPNVGEYCRRVARCAPRFAFPFHGGASWEGEGREGTRLGKNSPPFSPTSPSRGGGVLSCEKWFPVGRAVLKEMKNQGHGR